MFINTVIYIEIRCNCIMCLFKVRPKYTLLYATYENKHNIFLNLKQTNKIDPL